MATNPLILDSQTLQRLPVPATPILQMPNAGAMLPVPQAPSVLQAPPPPQALQAANTNAQLLGAQNEYSRLQNSGDGISQIKNPILHGLARTGNVLESILAPGAATFTPGTSEHHRMLLGQQQGYINQGLENQGKEAQTAEEQALTDYTQQRPEIEEAKIQQREEAVRDRVTELARANGQNTAWDPATRLPTFTDDPTSEAYLVKQATAAIHNANAAQAKIKAEIEQNRYIPGTREYIEAWKKIQLQEETKQIAAASLGLRAKGLQLREINNEAQNTGIDPRTGQPFAGAQQIADSSGTMHTIGSRFATGAVNAQGGAGQYNDVHGALDALEQTSAQLAAKTGGRLNTPGVVAALTAAHNANGGWVTGGVSNYLRGENAAALTPEEMNYVQAVQAAHENMQGLRKSAGGGTTDSQVDRLEAMIPNATTPNLDYLKGQTGQIRATADRLAPGVASVAGGLTVRNKGHQASGSQDSSIPAAAAAQLQEGIQHTFANGQVWTKQNGKPVRVK